jgi:hypothetical protein
MFNHLPWYTAKRTDRSSTLSAAACIVSAAMAGAGHDDGGGDHSSAESDAAGSIFETGGEHDEGATDASMRGVDDVVRFSSEVPAVLPSLVGERDGGAGGETATGRTRRAGGSTGRGRGSAAAERGTRSRGRGGRGMGGAKQQPQLGSSAAANKLAALRAQRAAAMQEHAAPPGFTSFRLTCDQKLAQQKCNVVRTLRLAVEAQRELFGAKLESFEDVFDTLDRDSSGSIDRAEFRQGIQRLGLGLTEPQIMEMVEVFDEDGNGEIDRGEFLALVNAPSVDVSTVARVQWQSAREKAEKANERMKEKAYALARQEAEQLASAIETDAAARLAARKNTRRAKVERQARTAQENEREARRRAREGVARRKSDRAERQERATSRMRQRQRLRRQLRSDGQQKLQDVSASVNEQLSSFSFQIESFREQRERGRIDTENQRALFIEQRRAEREDTRHLWLQRQEEERQRRQQQQQEAWERATSMVRQQTMRRVQRRVEQSIISQANRSLRQEISRPRSVA